MEEGVEIQEKNTARNGVAPAALELARDAKMTLTYSGQEYDDLQKGEAIMNKELVQLRTDMKQLSKKVNIIESPLD